MLAIHNIRSTRREPDPGSGVLRRGAVVAAALLAGCGNIPNGKINYYHATTSVTVKVIRSVTCDKNDLPVVVSTVTSAVSHSANQDAVNTLDLAWFRGPFSDADVKVESYDDGRLKSVNASSTGQGEAVVKAVATVLPLVGGAVKSLSRDPERQAYPAECAFIRRQAKDDPITIIYSGSISLAKPKDEEQSIPVEISSRLYALGVESAIGKVCAVMTETGKPPHAPLAEPEPGMPRLAALQPGWAKFKVKIEAPGQSGCKSEAFLISPRVLAAQFGLPYDIPIPRPALFGKQSVGIAFAESGALNTIQYSSTTGAVQALGGLNSLLTAAQGDTTAQQLAAVKAEADLIAQQQRLVQCLADPKNCPK